MSSNFFRRLVIPVDGSPCNDVAIDLALRLVGQDGELVFAHAIDVGAAISETSTPYGGDASIVIEALEADRRDVFAAATTRAQSAGVASRTVPLDGPPAKAIVAVATETAADAIVIGTHGRRGIARVALGSVTDGVLRRAEVPTFVVREQTRIPATGSIRRIVVAVDASEPAAAAVVYALRLAASYGADLTCVHVGDGLRAEAVELELDRVVSLAAAAHVLADIVRACGKPADAIATTAAAVRADLIAIGMHGREGADRLVLGSLAEGVVLTSALPVVVTHAKAAVAAGERDAGSPHAVGVRLLGEADLDR